MCCRLLTLGILLALVGARTASADDGLDAALLALVSADAQTRVDAARALGHCGRAPRCARAARALEPALFDAEPEVRRAALVALVELDARGAAGGVVRLLQVEREVGVLPSALLALGALHVAGQDDLVTRFAAHPHPGVRAAAVTAAGDLGGARMRRLVLNSLQLAGAEDEQWLVRASALLALARLGRPDDMTLIQRVFEEGGGRSHWIARSAVARAIAALHPAPRAALERLLADPDPRVAVTAAAGLAQAGLRDVLVGHLGDGRSAVRAAAVGGIRQADLRRTLPTLRRLAQRDPSRTVRWAAAVTLFEWQDPLGDELMLDALRAEDPAIWGEALARLARRQGARHGRDVSAWRAALRAR